MTTRERQPWATPFAMTRPVFIALAALVALGMAAVLGGAAVREHLHDDFRPDWAVWVPTTVGVGLGVLGLGLIALLAQRLPPKPFSPAGPMPRAVAPGTEQALRRGGPLTPEQEASAQQVVDALGDRRRTAVAWFGPVYLVLGVIGVVGHEGTGWPFVAFGVVMTPLSAWTLVHRRRVLRRAAELGYRPTPSR